MKKLLLIFLICLTAANLGLTQGELSYNDTTGILRIPFIKPPGKATVKDKKPQWSYLIELGNGEYREGLIPIDKKTPVLLSPNYQKRGTYKISLYLTPRYSNEFPPAPLMQEIEVRKLSSYNSNHSNSIPSRHTLKTVDLQTNVDHEAIRKHPIRVIFSHKNANPEKTGGYLIFLYNHNDDFEKLKIDPFIYKRAGEGVYYQLENGEQAISKIAMPALSVIDQIPNKELADQLRARVQDYRSHRVFRSEQLLPGESRNLFLTIIGDESLESKKSLDKEYLIKGLWIPDTEASTAFITNDYNFIIVPGHDPNTNKLYPNPAFYSTGEEQVFANEIIFKNNASGTVKDVTVGLKLSKDLDIDSVRIVSSACQPSFRVENDSFYSDLEERKCIKKRIVKEKDSLIVTFYNINLKRGEKGTLVYTVPTKAGRPGPIHTKGAVVFLGASKEKRLPRAKSHWRKKGRDLSMGLNFGHQMDGFYNRHGFDCFNENFTISIGLENRPLERGFGWGYGLAASQFQFEKVLLESYQMPNSCRDSRYLPEESFQLLNLDIMGNMAYQFNRWIRVKGEAGMTLPMRGTALFHRTEGRDLIEVERAFGLIGNNLPHTDSCFSDSFFEERNMAKASPGLVTSLTLEVGHMHIITAGLRIQHHYYPRFYFPEQVTISNYQLFFRINLPNMKELKRASEL